MKMTKFKKKKREDMHFAEKAYRTTQLDYGYTQQKIMEMMGELGIKDIRITKVGNDFMLEFMAQMRHGEAKRLVRINIPYTPELEDTTKQKQNQKNILFRVLFYHLKDKFVAISNGLKEFEEEFMADLVVEENGEQKRLGDIIVPKYKKMLSEGDVAIFKIKEGVSEDNK